MLKEAVAPFADIPPEHLAAMAATEADQALAANTTADKVVPLAASLSLYVNVEPFEPGSPQARKTTYSSGSEANAD